VPVILYRLDFDLDEKKTDGLRESVSHEQSGKWVSEWILNGI